uniref:Uncharacterized protein n=1 Tax=Panagrolaimus superbus TaxID=310955 RepID=A0A914YNM5_9BILA
MFQRQTHKKALSSCVVDAQTDVARHFSIGELRTLFELKTNIASDTHDKIKCKRCVNGLEVIEPPTNADTSSDLSNWFHSQTNPRKIPDSVLKNMWNCGVISFVFHQKSHEQTEEMKQKIKEEEEDAKDENYDPEKDCDSD